MPKPMRDVNDLSELVVKHNPRRSRRSLFSEEESAQYLLGDGGPLLDQNIGMDDLDPAFPDYNVAGLFNAYFRDGDPEDNTIDYWTINNGDGEITVEECAQSPGGICVVYAPTGAVSTASYLISGAAPAAIGVDYGVIVALGNFTTGAMYVKASLTWYDEAENEITTTYGQKKLVEGQFLKWLKIPRSKGAQAASFVSMKLEFSSTGVGFVTVYGVKLFELLPAENNEGDPVTVDPTEPVTPISPAQSMGLYLYDDFERDPGIDASVEYSSQDEFADEVVLPLPDGIVVGDTVVVGYGFSSSSGGVSNFWKWNSTGSYGDWHNAGSSFNGDAPSIGRSSFNVRKIDGTEGFTGSGDTIVIANASSDAVSHTQLDQLWSMAFIIKDVSDLGSPDNDIGWNGSPSSGFPNTLDPTSGWTNWTNSADDALWLFIAVSDKPITGAFDGTILFNQSVTGLGNSSEFHMIIAVLPDDSSTHDAGTIAWDAAGYGLTILLALKVDVATDFGNILAGADTGAPWVGDTPWLTEDEVWGTPDDGLPALSDGAARFYGDGAGGARYLDAFQIGSTWKRAAKDVEVIGYEDDALVSDSYSEGTSFFTLNYPDGCDVPGRHLIMWVAANPYRDLYNEFVTTYGWTKLLATSGTTFYWKRLGGADGEDPTGYAATGASDAIEIDDAPGTPIVKATVMLVEGLYDEGSSNPGPWYSSAFDGSADCDDFPTWAYESNGFRHLYLTAIRCEDVINDTPEFADEGSTATYIDAGSGYDDLYLSWDWQESEDEPVENSGEYDTDDDMSGIYDSTWTIILRGGGMDPAGTYVTDVEKAEGPHNVPHISLWKCRFTDGIDGAYFQYDWYGSEIEGVDRGGGFKVVKVDFPGTGEKTAFNLQGQVQSDITNWVLGEWYYVLLDLTGTVQRAKVWKFDEAMPATWQHSYAYSGGNSSLAYLEMGGPFTDGFEVDEIWIGLGPEDGLSGRVYIGAADGTSTTYTSPLQWGSGGPKVYVDGYLTILASYDASDWSFTFDRAPSYGAKIEVEV